ncbi:membrane-bound lytic murein transglycosylase MltF [Nocardioides cavernae]|uniref:Membrane-bound lytic murein transglycosylase MltF n=1 Tax=Nocardioides cavernae TaxID=1921566 RepID=A0A7Y9H2J8_9ACTN|nr:transporter substrate-binding domain-containing protein [Nocardioides cavernae]NYE36758.1 membrane-bound lytic murein transglycosylase MltF [Nocardioides cavernae]
MHAVRQVSIVLAALLLGGCGLSIPTDPDGTLDHVRTEGVLRAGASPRAGWVDLDGGDPGGREPELVTRFADDLGAEVEWTVAGEEELVRMLDEGEIDVAVGGFTEDNAWVDEVGLTRAYTSTHVMMVPMGENALQSELERWLDAHGGGA